MERTEKDAYSKVLNVTSCYVEIIRRDANDDNSVGTVCRYKQLANTIATKILSNNNTKFILVCKESGIKFSIVIGNPIRKKIIVIKNFKLSYSEDIVE